MKYYEDVLGLIGNTPLVRLNKLVPPGGATLLAKMEQLNPGGSVKDRMAYNMVRRAEEEGLLRTGRVPGSLSLCFLMVHFDS